MINRELIGQWGPDFEMPVERGKIREFARALYAPWPEYLDASRPVIHPVFLVSAGVYWGYTLERPRGTLLEGLNHDLTVPLHAEESYVFHGTPPRAGTTLTARACLEQVVEKQGQRGGSLTFLTLLTEFRDESGQLAAEARAVTVTTSSDPDGGHSWSANVPDYQPEYSSLEPRDPFVGITRQSWKDLVEGQGPAKISAGPLTLHEMVRFQAAGGEDNPLHYDLAHAKRQGYPALFGLGMHQAGALASYAVAWLGPLGPRRFKTRFRNVYWIGDPLSYSGKVDRLYEEAGRRRADVVLECTRDSDGAVIADTWMTFEL
jgi:acyl dehydratase